MTATETLTAGPPCPVCQADATVRNPDGSLVCVAGCYWRSEDDVTDWTDKLASTECEWCSQPGTSDLLDLWPAMVAVIQAADAFDSANWEYDFERTNLRDALTRLREQVEKQ